jgi:hypothetical protein
VVWGGTLRTTTTVVVERQCVQPPHTINNFQGSKPACSHGCCCCFVVFISVCVENCEKKLPKM